MLIVTTLSRLYALHRHRRFIALHILRIVFLMYAREPFAGSDRRFSSAEESAICSRNIDRIFYLKISDWSTIF